MNFKPLDPSKPGIFLDASLFPSFPPCLPSPLLLYPSPVPSWCKSIPPLLNLLSPLPSPFLPPSLSRPLIRSLYDVFSAIRDDESEHVKTINACQVADEVILSPNAAAAHAAWAEQVEEEEEEEVARSVEEEWWREYDALGKGRGWDGEGGEGGGEGGEWGEEVEFE